MMNLPFKETWLIDFGIVFFIIVIILLILFIVRRIWDLFRSEADRKFKHEGCIGCYVKLFMIVFLFWISVGIIAIAILVQSFYSFSDRQLIAVVNCEQIRDKNYDMRFTITYQNDKSTFTYNLNGDEWVIHGELLRWNGLMNFFGFKDMYRLKRIGGQYRGAPPYNRRPKTLYDLEKSANWNWLLKFGSSLPMLEVIPIGVHRSPADNKIYKLYVKTSGFSLINIGKHGDEKVE